MFVDHQTISKSVDKVGVSLLSSPTFFGLSFYSRQRHWQGAEKFCLGLEQYGEDDGIHNYTSSLTNTMRLLLDKCSLSHDKICHRTHQTATQYITTARSDFSCKAV